MATALLEKLASHVDAVLVERARGVLCAERRLTQHPRTTRQCRTLCMLSIPPSHPAPLCRHPRIRREERAGPRARRTRPHLPTEENACRACYPERTHMRGVTACRRCNATTQHVHSGNERRTHPRLRQSRTRGANPMRPPTADLQCKISWATCATAPPGPTTKSTECRT